MLQIQNKVIKAAILDMDGVLWRMNTPIIDLPKLFTNFEQHGIKVMLATNNGTATIDGYVKKLSGFGVEFDKTQVVTSAMALAFLLKKHYPSGGPLYILGESALIETLAELGFYHSEEKPLAVAAGLDRAFTYEKIKNASLMIQKGLPFYFTNPDPTYPTPEGIIPGAGTLLAALETASGVKAQLAGKPLPFLFEVCLERLECTAEETLVVGDRLDTDILGGQASGCKTALVLTGISSREEGEAWNPKPDLILDKISDLFD
ncbi:MAG: HAD-IIA family hydrolase [Anaerolineae bacterium]|jgi:4-nitrophenyl phosphatase|nr:HAD-IIA family hydrolase [Anaerolineae bacterium]